MKFKNYAQGKWIAGEGEGKSLFNAITGEKIGTASSKGLDFAAMMDYARKTGGPALSKMTFQERGLMLKKLALHLISLKKKFYSLSAATGATKIDSWIDIEGGIGNLFANASLRRQFGDQSFYVDGDMAPLSKEGTFIGHHIMVPKQGVAIHINAFNFPVWGMLEKIAVNFMAGVPAIVKPANITCYLTELVVQEIVASKILPEGALQLICGSANGILDHVCNQDIVTFTGSASTGKMLKAHPRLLEEAVPFNMEADSLNASILAEDAIPGTEEFDLFIKEVQKEMKEKVTQLAKSQEIVYGNLDTFEVTGADKNKGAFLSPILFLNNDPFNKTDCHNIEAFGPVSTIIPYKNLEEAIELAKMGKGSLVCSIVTNDDKIAKEFVMGAAAFHGRILILNAACAKESTGHGSPMPLLTHGGPGRAGGGEEMGGKRGILHYMQRTAIQGSPTMLTKITNQYQYGAEQVESDKHVFQKYFEEIEIGDTVITRKHTVTDADIVNFANVSGDHFYAHVDATALDETIFERNVAHGYWVLSKAAGLFVDGKKGPVLLNYGLDECRFTKPVYPGMTIGVKFTAKEKISQEQKVAPEGEELGKGEGIKKGIVKFLVDVYDETGETVALATILTMIKFKNQE